MGQEIDRTAFTGKDFARFAAKLGEETSLLSAFIREGRCSTVGPIIGVELEAWLVDEQMQPAPLNTEYLEILADPLASPELAKFNVEFNSYPTHLDGSALSRLESELAQTLNRAYQAASKLGLHLITIGILPTLRDTHLIPANMSTLKRYHALNEQILRTTGKPIQVDISGHQHIRRAHPDVMLEAATTSFQIHLQDSAARIHRLYNAAMLASAPLVAVSQNSPFLFGRDLWGETRIALFEQAVPVGGFRAASSGPLHRVGFGSGYARRSIGECFEENLQHYPALLPICYDTEPGAFAHLRLHNGTIWRWNRPLVGFDPDGTPHLRIEHRVMPSGPTVVDSVANAAFYFGLTESFCEHGIESFIPFAQARDDFYLAARHGLDAHVVWIDGEKLRLRALLQKRLLPMAREGLESLHVDTPDIDRFLGAIQERVNTGQTGTEWQRQQMRAQPGDFARMTATYLENQVGGRPVHEWRSL